MLNKNAILQTMVSYWSEEDGFFVTESPLLPRTAGVGNSKAESELHFGHMLEDIYADYLAGNLHGYDKRGRPSKGIVSMHVQVRPSTKEFIDDFAGGIDISQGDAIEYFVSYYRAQALTTEVEPWSPPQETGWMTTVGPAGFAATYTEQFLTPSELSQSVNQSLVA
jgi:hypothetical protein